MSCTIARICLCGPNMGFHLEAGSWTCMVYPWRESRLNCCRRLSSIVSHAASPRAGEYELQAPEPGDYLIAVNWDELPSEMHFATALFPGVDEVETATPVHTQEAGTVVLPDFRHPTPVECAVQIRIDDRDGTPSKAARILTKHFPEQFWHPTGDMTPRGTAIVTIVGPSPTYLVASRPLSIQQELRSEVTTIKSCPTDPIHLRLTKTIQVE